MNPLPTSSCITEYQYASGSLSTATETCTPKYVGGPQIFVDLAAWTILWLEVLIVIGAAWGFFKSIRRNKKELPDP